VAAHQEVQRLSEACRHERTAPWRRSGGGLLRPRHVRCDCIEEDLLRRCAEPAGSCDTADACPCAPGSATHRARPAVAI